MEALNAWWAESRPFHPTAGFSFFTKLWHSSRYFQRLIKAIYHQCARCADLTARVARLSFLSSLIAVALTQLRWNPNAKHSSSEMKTNLLVTSDYLQELFIALGKMYFSFQLPLSTCCLLPIATCQAYCMHKIFIFKAKYYYFILPISAH